MSDEFKIQLKIAGKTFPFRCKRSEEEIIRKAARNINDMILQYSTAFPGAELELKDLLAMVAFHFSLENLKKKNTEDISPLFDKIEGLNLELEEYFKLNR